MTKAILLVAATVLCMVGAVVLLVVGIVLAVRRRVRLGLLLGFTALALVVTGVLFGGVLAVKSFRAIHAQAYKMAEGRSGSELFAFAVMKEIPASVEILHSQDDLFPLGCDPVYWLHFRISAEDFSHLLKQHPYQAPEAKTADRLDAMYPPQWWQLNTLGEEVEAFKFDAYRHKHPDTPIESTVLWVNKEHTEVYFCLIYY